MAENEPGALQGDIDRQEVISRLCIRITEDVLSEGPEISADDPTLLAAVKAATQYVEGRQNLVSLRRSVESARSELQTALAALRGGVIAAADSGVAETQITKQAGLNRQTVRTYVGKDSSRRGKWHSLRESL
ncbi:hypothetical protein V2J52_14160 [Georgenia sp. MJ173]|uniref:hypothetical protein n=1 Tax=Georgenia sunbinii TaxID=3117728 RepID=UPI002F264B2F